MVLEIKMRSRVSGSAGRSPSRYQQAVLDEISNGNGNVLVEATAGSGKTTLLEMCSQIISGRGLFLAFNRHTAEELSNRVRPMECRTIHSLGKAIVRSKFRSLNLNQYKASEIVKRFSGNLSQFCDSEGVDRFDWFSGLLDFARLALWDGGVESLRSMVEEFEIVLPGKADDRLSVVADILRQALQSGLDDAANHGVIDFTDMIWLPVALDLPAPQYDWIFVDESQDLNACQIALMKKAGSSKARFLIVGDRDQSIYGFAGSVSAAIDLMAADLNASRYPLSICYRCPKAHVELAQNFSSKIEVNPEAVEGIVSKISLADVVGLVAVGDFILSRKTAALTSLCLDLIAAGVKASVKGKSGGAQIVGAIKAISAIPEFAWTSFEVFFAKYKATQLRKIKAEELEERSIALNDLCETIRLCYDRFECDSICALIDRIEEIFTPEGSEVTLLTIHRAKGLEADRVFLLNPDELPLVWRGQTEDQRQQEVNVAFVAYTRSKRELFLVSDS